MAFALELMGASDVRNTTPDPRQVVMHNGRPEAARFAWHEFAFRVSLPPGEHVLVALATDREGNAQPLSPRWNSLGYANNAVRPTRIRVRV